MDWINRIGVREGFAGLGIAANAVVNGTVKTADEWAELGRKPKRGETGVKLVGWKVRQRDAGWPGAWQQPPPVELFHTSQVEPVAAAKEYVSY